MKELLLDYHIYKNTKSAPKGRFLMLCEQITNELYIFLHSSQTLLSKDIYTHTHTAL